MLSMTFLAVVASVLSIVPFVSMSSDEGYVKDTYWTYGEVSDKSEIYISIKTIVLEGTDSNGSAINEKYNWYVRTCKV
jgi:hypothetical protein